MQTQKYLIAFVVIAIATLLVFAKSIPYEFVEWDDGFFIYENKIITSFSPENLESMLLNQHYGIYTPVLWLSLALDYQFFGLNAWGYRLTNLIFHILNMGMIMYLFRYFIDVRKYPALNVIVTSAVVALLWSIHPLRVESVVWASQRRDVLSAFFCLISLILYLQHSRKYASRDSFLRIDNAPSQDWKYPLSIFFYLLALLAKPSVVPFPIVLVMMDIYPLQRFRFDISILPRLFISCLDKWAYFLFGACAGFLTIASHAYIKGIYPLSQLSLEHRFSNAIYCLAMYLIDTILPLTLLPYYKKQNISFFDPLIILSVIFYALVIYWLIQLAVRKKIFWGLSMAVTYCAMLFPILGFFQAGSGGAGNRFTYLATIGFFFCLGALILKTKKKQWVWAIIMLWGCGLIAKNITQQSIWKDSEKYFDYMIAMEPKSTAATYNKLAGIKQRQGDIQKALQIYDNALRTDGTPEQWSDSFNGMGNIFFEFGNFDKAEFFYLQAITAYPQAHLAYNNLGNIHVKRNEYEQAEALYKQSIQYNNKYAGAYYNLGLLYRILHRLDDAEKFINQASLLSPQDPEIQKKLNEIRKEKSRLLDIKL